MFGLTITHLLSVAVGAGARELVALVVNFLKAKFSKAEAKVVAKAESVNEAIDRLTK